MLSKLSPRNISLFIGNVKSELVKCSYPWDSDPSAKGFKKYRELAGSTGMVLLATCLLGAYVAFFDLLLQKLVEIITSLVH